MHLLLHQPLIEARKVEVELIRTIPTVPLRPSRLGLRRPSLSRRLRPRMA